MCEARRVSFESTVILRESDENRPEGEKDIADDFNGRIFRIEWSFESTVGSFQCYLIQCLCPLIICFPYLEGRLFVNLSELRYEQFFHSLLLRLSQTSEDMVLAKLASALLSAI